MVQCILTLNEVYTILLGQFDLCIICLFQGREASSSQASKDEANDKRGDKTL